MNKLEKFKELFPESISDEKIDIGVLKQILGEHLKPEPEKFEFTWVGKKESLKSAETPTDAILEPCPEESVDWDTTQNIFIEGDNLDALKILQKEYLGKVKMIYIDPPYNTGNKFVYKDKFQDSVKVYKRKRGIPDKRGYKLSNSEESDRRHSNWLNMMLPRLNLAKNLLKEEGVIFISIDDNEVSNLRKMCDEIFGEENFIVSIIWEKLQTRKNSARYFSESHEYILAFAKKIELWQRNLLPRESTDSVYRNPDNDPNGPWKLDRIYANNPYSADYTITSPSGKIFSRPEGKYWRYSEESINRFIEEDRLIWTDPNSYPHYKRYLSEVQDGLVPISLFDRKFAGDNGLASREQESLLGIAKVMSYPKPAKLVERLLQIGSCDGDLIMDFFAGSSTSAHAIINLSVADKGDRHYVMVQIPEPCDEKSEAYKAGYKTIAEISKERIRRAATKIKEENPDYNGDLGFKVFKIKIKS